MLPERQDAMGRRLNQPRLILAAIVAALMLIGYFAGWIHTQTVVLH